VAASGQRYDEHFASAEVFAITIPSSVHLRLYDTEHKFRFISILDGCVARLTSIAVGVHALIPG
jgi:hypothetical protein